MKVSYNNKTNRFSLLNLTEDEANAILRSLQTIVEKMDYNEELGFYIDRGDCFAMPTESYKAASSLLKTMQGSK